MDPVSASFDRAHLQTIGCNYGIGHWRKAYDRNTVRRARAAFRRNVANPGDCRGDTPMLAALAVAEAIHGRGAGWLPLVQATAVRIVVRE